MEEDRTSSSSDEFDFGALDNEITLISDSLRRETNESSGEDGDVVRGVRRRKIRIIESDSEAESDIESDAVEGASNSTWVLCEDYNEVPPNVPFIPGQNITATRIASNTQQPIDFFKLFFTNDLVKEIIQETNLYAKRRLEGKTLSANSIWRSWRDVTLEEFWAFLAVIINMGTMPLANLQEYWSKNAVSYIPFYADTFTRDRFSQIFWMLHLKSIPTSNTNPRTRLQRVNCFLEYVSSKFLDYFIPGEHICVDESTVKFKGRISFITYNPKKPTKWGIRVYALADSKTGYICCILPYYGSLTTELLVRPDLPVSTRIPLHLYQMSLEKIPGAQGHHMYTDRYYTSYILAQELSKLNCHLTGTILTNRKELPKEIKKPNFSKKLTVAYRRGKTLVLGWKDKRVVTCLTTRGDTGMTTFRRITRGGVDIMVKKPNVVLNYIKYMGGVDLADQYASTCCFLRKSLKWWHKLFFGGMEISLINSYILYKQEKIKKGEKPLSHRRYVKTLVEQLRGPYRQQRQQASTSHSDEIRLNGKLHIMLKGPKRDCKVCSDRSTPGGRRGVTYYCDTCPEKPRMHLGHCFIKYHTKTNYRV
ncbi:PREDICTED: piggyBac transposable element-derived protein 4-like [Dufourea novaeangliae]|uniref:piggyBac transposable element-derived protein 4-like n=1 Tax=Dufourea novaeangliae TaxID=178035 RepID=UPI000767607C|nr:PREDICTED: piggyBac transposable element-derived protein 4-like [Dufourea novaeangliae]